MVSGGTLTLNSGTTITNTTAADSVTVDSGATLTLDDTSSISGGTITVDSGGTLTMAGSGDSIDGSAVTVQASGALNMTGTDIISGSTLTIDGMLKAEGTDTIESFSSGNFTDNGEVLVTGSGTVLTLKTDTLTNISGTVKVDSNATLKVSGTTITGGPLALFGLSQAQVVAGTVVFPSVSVLDLNSTDAAVLTLTATASGGGTLSLDSNTGQTAIAVSGTYSAITGELDGITYTPPQNGGVDVDGTYTVTFSVEGAGEAAFKTETITVSNSGALVTVATTDSNGLIVNDGLIDITGASTFKSDDLNNTSGTLKVEASQTLTLIHTSVKGGTVTDSGLIEVQSTNAINNASLNGGRVTVESGAKLTLDDTTVSGTTITDTDATSIIQVHDGDTLTLIDGAVISGGTLTLASGATLDIEDAGTPAATLDGVAVTNVGATIEVGQTSTATLLVDDGTSISGGTLTIGASGFTGTLDVEKGGNAAAPYGATLDGVTVTDYAASDGITVGATSTATLTLEGDTSIFGGTITVDGGGTLVMDGSGLGDTISGSAITVDASGMLNMTGIDTISGGSLLVYGTLKADGTADAIADSSNVTIEFGGLLNISGSLTLSDDTVTNDQAQGIVVSGGSLTLNSGTTITNSATADSIIVDFWHDADAGRHLGDLRRRHHGGRRRQAGHGRQRARRHHLGQRHHGRCQRCAEHDRDRHDLGRQHYH